MTVILHEVFANGVSVYRSYDWYLTQQYVQYNYSSWFYEQVNEHFARIIVY